MNKNSEITAPTLVDECILSRGIEIHELLRVRKEALLYIQPCASEKGKLMADIELSNDIDADFFDPNVLCSLLEIHRRRFAELKCSPSLGVAKVKWKGWEMSVFKNGKLKIQRGQTREELLKVANATSRLVWGAAICGVCGKPALVCASGNCKCKKGETTVNVKDLPSGELLQQALDLLKTAESEPATSEKNSQKAKYFALHFVAETPDKKNAAVGLALLAKA